MEEQLAAAEAERSKAAQEAAARAAQNAEQLEAAQNTVETLEATEAKLRTEVAQEKQQAEEFARLLEEQLESTTTAARPEPLPPVQTDAKPSEEAQPVTELQEKPLSYASTVYSQGANVNVYNYKPSALPFGCQTELAHVPQSNSAKYALYASSLKYNSDISPEGFQSMIDMLQEYNRGGFGSVFFQYHAHLVVYAWFLQTGMSFLELLKLPLGEDLLKYYDGDLEAMVNAYHGGGDTQAEVSDEIKLLLTDLKDKDMCIFQKIQQANAYNFNKNALTPSATASEPMKAFLIRLQARCATLTKEYEVEQNRRAQVILTVLSTLMVGSVSIYSMSGTLIASQMLGTIYQSNLLVFSRFLRLAV